MSDDFDDLLRETAKPQTEVPHRVVGAPEIVPTMFADTALFAYRFGGTIRVQFVEMNNAPSDAPEPGITSRHVFNLVMPVEGFSNFLEYLNKSAREWNLPIIDSDKDGDGNG